MAVGQMRDLRTSDRGLGSPIRAVDLGGESMSAGSDLVRRSGDLKGELVDFAQGPRFARSFRRALKERFAAVATVEEEQFINFLDWFVLQHRLPDGRTVVERFVAARPDLSNEERAMLLGWRDVVEGIFEVQRRDGEALLTVNLVDELPYRVRSNMGPAVFSRMPRRSFLLTRLVPIGDKWLLSGAARVVPAASSAEAHRTAAELAVRHPALALRDPERVARAWELQREDRRWFVAFFGSDLVVCAGSELAGRMRAYGEFRMREARDAEGTSAADRAQQRYGVTPATPDFGALPADLCDADTVGVIYDEVEGLNYFANFGLVQAAFADPELAAYREHRRAVLGYLKEPSISPLPLRRLAEPDPERASRVFRQVLRRPGFSWERDGEALLRRNKASWFQRPAVPSVVPVGPVPAGLGQPVRRSHKRRLRPSRPGSGEVR
jgi:hypothetical protein